METRIDARKKDFKKSFDDPRRKREDQQVQIRKAIRDAHLSKKRQQQVGAVAPNGRVITLDDLPILVEALMSDNPDAQYEASQHFRRLLSIERKPPLQEIIECGVVPRFAEFLRAFDRPAIQFEAAWALTNIASGTPEQTKAVAQANAIPLFIDLFKSPQDDVREQAIWALGNIAGDCPELRDMVLQYGGLQPIMKEIAMWQSDPSRASVLKNATWTLSNLCRGKPEPKFELIEPALPTLRVLIYMTDPEILADACWALSYLSDGTEPACIEAVIRAGVCYRLVELLSHSVVKVQTPALRAVGNIVTGDDTQTQAILMCGALPSLKKLLTAPKRPTRKEACWAISNVTAGSREQIQAVINEGIMPIIIEILANADFDVKKEAAWAVANAALGGNVKQVEYLIECGCIKPLSDLLDVDDPKVVTVALESIENILKVGRVKQQQEGLSENPYVALLEKADAFPKFEKLQYMNESTDMYKTTIRIMTTYLDVEAENDGGDMQVAADDQQFEFGAAAVGADLQSSSSTTGGNIQHFQF